MRFKELKSVLNKGQKFVAPEKTIKLLDIKEGDKVADYGAGIGFWTLPLSKEVGRKGRVYALSSNEDFSNLLKSKIKILGLNNVEVVTFDHEGDKIKIEEKVDLVLMANVLHVIREDEAAIKSARDILKKDGRLVVIEYLKLKTLFGPPRETRVSEEELMMMAEKLDLKFKCTIDAGFHHYGMIFVKK